MIPIIKKTYFEVLPYFGTSYKFFFQILFFYCFRSNFMLFFSILFILVFDKNILLLTSKNKLFPNKLKFKT